MTTGLMEEIEQNIKVAKPLMESGSALRRLRSNRDFKQVILDGYFEKEPIRLVHLKADPAMQTVLAQSSILAQIDAIGSFSNYLNTVLRRADLAVKEIDDNETARSEILADEADVGGV